MPTNNKFQLKLEMLLRSTQSASFTRDHKNHSQLNFLICAIIFSCSAYLLNSSWTYNRYGSLDHFAYLGAAYFFPEVNKQFPNSTTIELLPTYLPAAFLYHVFTPQLANFLRDIIYLILSLYMYMEICYFLTTDIILTILSAIVISSYNYFLSSIGSDYTDSTIQILCIAHLFIIIKIFDKNNDFYYSRKSFFCLGVLSALLFSSGVLGLVYIVNFFLFITTLYYFDKVLFNWNLKQKITLIVIYLTGIFASIVSISIYLKSIDHGYYMKQNLLKLFGYLGGVFQNPLLMDWLPYSGWLILPAAVVLASAVYLIIHSEDMLYLAKNYNISPHQNLHNLESKSNIPFLITGASSAMNLIGRKLAFLIFLFSVSGSMIFIQFIVKQWSLQFMYFSQINFIYFIGLTIFISDNFRSIAIKSKLILLFLTAILSGYYLHLTTYRVISFEEILNLFPFQVGSIAPWTIIILCLTFVFTLYLKKLIPVSIILLSVLSINLINYSQYFGGFCCIDALPLKFFGMRGTTSENVFDDTIKLANFLDKLDKHRKYDVWFDDKELLGQIYRQVFSMNYFNLPENMINKLLPELGDYSGPRGSSGHEPVNSRNIILISDDIKKLDQAIDNLSRLLNKSISYEMQKIKVGEVQIFVYLTS